MGDCPNTNRKFITNLGMKHSLGSLSRNISPVNTREHKSWFPFAFILGAAFMLSFTSCFRGNDSEISCLEMVAFNLHWL